MKLVCYGIIGLLAGISTAAMAADQCAVQINTNLYGNAKVKCVYQYTMTIENDGSISSPGGTRTCTGSATTQLGAGSGGLMPAGSPAEAYILFPYIADVEFNFPTEREEGHWTSGLVVSLSDRGGSSPVTSSYTYCVDK
jgi:hypothetical protein